jgi:hypothetical protein
VRVQLERLSVRLRPRGGWEALDLGFHMARTWWREVWGVWLAVFLPAAVVLHVVFNQYLWIAAVVLWWLKPAFDRFVLHVVSRAVFGDIPTVRTTLAAWREILWPGLIAGLSWHRFSLVRSFMLPVAQLEKQSGAGARSRRTALGKRMRAPGAWLTITLLHFEAFLYMALGVMIVLLVPGASDPAPEFGNLLGGRGEEGAWSLFNSLCYVLAVSAVEPFYVAGGFSLYLNRRAILEGWDIELQLRRLDERLRGAAVAILAALVLCFAPTPAIPTAQAAEGTAKEAIEEILKAPELNPFREEKRWRLRPGEPGKDDDKPAREFGDFRIGKLFADIVQGLAWVAAAIAAGVLLWFAWRHLQQHLASRREEAWRPPDVLFGLSVTPESLPDDVAGTAAALVREGRVREALSLLYRGALSVLVHRDRVRLVEGDTEGDALRAARHTLAADASDYFASLVRAWTLAAYAGRLPGAEDAAALARSWAPYFGSRPQAQTA